MVSSSKRDINPLKNRLYSIDRERTYFGLLNILRNLRPSLDALIRTPFDRRVPTRKRRQKRQNDEHDLDLEKKEEL